MIKFQGPFNPLKLVIESDHGVQNRSQFQVRDLTALGSEKWLSHTL